MDTDGIKHPSNGDNESGQSNSRKHGRIEKLKDQMYSRVRQPTKRPRRRLSRSDAATPRDWEHATREKADTSDSNNNEVATPRQSRFRFFSWPGLLLIVAIIVFVIASGIAIAFFISGGNIVSSRNIDIAVNGPRTISGGDLLELQVSVRNNNNATLELADLVVTYPKGTRNPSSPQPIKESQRIPLGTIEPGGVRNGTVRAIMLGRDGGKQDIDIDLEYRLAGSSALFVAEKTHTVLMSSGTLGMSLESDREIVAGQSTDMTLTITSQAQTTLSDVVLRASYPFGFEPTTSSPEPTKDNYWELGDIEPGEKRTIRILGKLDGQIGDTRVFRFVTGIRLDERKKLVDVPLADFEQKVLVTRPFLDMSLSFGDRPARDYVAQTGEAIPVTLSWRNNLDVALEDVVIAATISGPGLDPFNISASRGFFRSIDSLVLWDKTTTRGRLERIAPAESGELSLRLTPKRAEDLSNVKNPTISFELHAAGQRSAEGDVPETLQATVQEEVKLATDATFAARALYFENPLGSVGPLPPRVEQQTTYGILWEISNSTNLMRDTKVVATLPPYVRWLDTVSPAVERVTFNATDGTVTWHVGKFLPDTGVGNKVPRRVVFTIGLVPSASQVGESPALIQNQILEGIDTFVNKTIRTKIGNLTTELKESEFTSAYGNVMP